MRNLTGLLFAGGLGFMLLSIAINLDFGTPTMLIGGAIQSNALQETGATNIVTSVVLGYRGIDTLGELSILFAAAASAGLILGRRHTTAGTQTAGGFVLRHGGSMLFPLLMTIGFYIIFHGHLSPGGGFQGGVILAAAFFLPLLARPGAQLHHGTLSLIEGLAGASFVLIGLIALQQGKAFLQPMLIQDTLGVLLSAGTLPLLYLAVGLKVGAELASLLSHLAQTESDA
ncbi:MAG: sodium:proton antiporter [Candidatus Thiodiazotropha sp. (ex Lucinoma borealis)]|nr:sodium:proton antiporter [Candidatus Thiodiazotropha sp. (ex Lucinoma borealis)]MCU7841131.1 sodium:proton antiporter [Candidatus Thiodiazotropha sp. (ex Troendleina suluensis)]MCU7946579.1 sodium:proton antiporter [Candidatus Thiodiazotropha sp. (ex Cardiolucina cf. quadrata)]MCU7866669.1 sodium:proton antiporter [Candidatus Thiodiazotropha sp. (ex Lucinoma borealis)]MCU7867753.1 sodium:proton antiporter [Candidatus Thiodiazotropha sp. (ex Lucinoma borealis)]